ncbi:MAG: hypothetical protein RL385_521, partial [Pseudomonadota bacterium]
CYRSSSCRPWACRLQSLPRSVRRHNDSHPCSSSLRTWSFPSPESAPPWRNSATCARRLCRARGRLRGPLAEAWRPSSGSGLRRFGGPLELHAAARRRYTRHCGGRSRHPCRTRAAPGGRPGPWLRAARDQSGARPEARRTNRRCRCAADAHGDGGCPCVCHRRGSSGRGSRAAGHASSRRVSGGAVFSRQLIVRGGWRARRHLRGAGSL